MDLWIKGMVYKEVGDHIYDVDVASEHDIQQRAVLFDFSDSRTGYRTIHWNPFD